MRPGHVPLAALAVGGLITVGALVVTAGPAAAAPPTAPIVGDGSSWAAPAVFQWSRDVEERGLHVDYNPDGSAAGRESFQQYQGQYAVSDVAYQPPESQARKYAYLPLTAGAIAFPYQVVVAGKRKRNVRLSGTTLADIFANRITNWNDPAITSDNNGHQVAPNLPIIPVTRADGSATSYHLTEWFSTRFPGRWRPYSDDGATEFFPDSPRYHEVSGSDQVTTAVDAPADNGAIGYVENAYPLTTDTPVAAVRNPAGFYTPPAPGNVGIALRAATRTGTGPADLTGVFANDDARSYPLSYYSYAIIPTARFRVTTAQRQALVDFFGYTACGGQSEADALGYAALPLNLTRAALRTLALLHAIDHAVDTSPLSLADCGNPTIAHGADGSVSDNLGPTVPQPPACARDGAGPCAPRSPAAEIGPHPRSVTNR